MNTLVVNYYVDFLNTECSSGFINLRENEPRLAIKLRLPLDRVHI
jgi:hypothetical protein